MSSRKLCYACDLVDNPELIELYKEYHTKDKAWPENGTASIKSLGKSAPHTQKIRQIRLLSTGEKLKFKQLSNALEVYFPNQKPEASFANALEIV